MCMWRSTGRCVLRWTIYEMDNAYLKIISVTIQLWGKFSACFYDYFIRASQILFKFHLWTAAAVGLSDSFADEWKVLYAYRWWWLIPAPIGPCTWNVATALSRILFSQHTSNVSNVKTSKRFRNDVNKTTRPMELPMSVPSEFVQPLEYRCWWTCMWCYRAAPLTDRLYYSLHFYTVAIAS